MDAISTWNANIEVAHRAVPAAGLPDPDSQSSGYATPDVERILRSLSPLTGLVSSSEHHRSILIVYTEASGKPVRVARLAA